MVNFPILYTGKGTSKPLKDMGNTFEEFSQKYVDAQKMKLQKKMKDEQFLLNNQIDPIQFMADQSMEKQAERLDWYNKKYSKIRAANNGYLSTQNKIQMASDKRKMLAEQQQMKAAEKRAIMDYEIYTKNPGKYDTDDFMEGWGNFLLTGDYPVSTLEPSAINATKYFSEINLKGKQHSDRENIETGPYNVLSATMDEAKQRFWGEVYHDVGQGGGRLLKGIKQDFRALGEDEKREMLDVNGDGRLSPEEERLRGIEGDMRSNPIMQWAEKRYSPMMIKSDFRAGRQKDTGGDTDFSFMGYKYEVKSAKPTPLGDTVYQQYHDVERAQTISVPLNDVLVIRGGIKGEDVHTEIGDEISVRITGYDADSDKFFFRAQEDFTPRDIKQASIKDGQTIGVSRGDLPKRYDDFMVLVNGKKMKVGDIARDTKNEGGWNFGNVPNPKK